MPESEELRTNLEAFEEFIHEVMLRTEIKTLDDLVDKRAQAIAKKYQLDPAVIFPYCLELNIQVSESRGKLIVDVLTEDDLSRYEKMVACAVVLAYEQSESQSIQFPAPKEKSKFGCLGRFLDKYLPFTQRHIFASRSVDGVRPNIIKALEKVGWKAQRSGHQIYYEIIGQVFEDNLNHIRHHIPDNKIIIYGLNHIPPWIDPATRSFGYKPKEK